MLAPLVSVIIPAFNAAETIQSTISSALAIPRVTVIVVDDGSTDDTANRAMEMGVTVIQQVNSGASEARRRGLSAAVTEYVIFLDSDDEVVGSGVAASILMLDSDPALVVVAGRVLGIMPDESEKLLPQAHAPLSPESLVQVGHGPWPPAAGVVRRSALDEISQLPIAELSTRYAEDFELLIRLSMVGRLVQHDKASARYRLYVGKSSRRPELAIQDKETIRNHYADALGIMVPSFSDREVRAAGMMRGARTDRANGRTLGAAVWMLRAFTASPEFFVRKLRRRPVGQGKAVSS